MVQALWRPIRDSVSLCVLYGIVEFVWDHCAKFLAGSFGIILLAQNAFG